MSYLHGDAAFSLCYIVPPHFPHNLPLTLTELYLSNTSFLGPTQPTTLNRISIESAIFPKYTVVTNGQTNGQMMQKQKACKECD